MPPLANTTEDPRSTREKFDIVNTDNRITTQEKAAHPDIFERFIEESSAISHHTAEMERDEEQEARAERLQAARSGEIAVRMVFDALEQTSNAQEPDIANLQQKYDNFDYQEQAAEESRLQITIATKLFAITQSPRYLKHVFDTYNVRDKDEIVIAVNQNRTEATKDAAGMAKMLDQINKTRSIAHNTDTHLSQESDPKIRQRLEYVRDDPTGITYLESFVLPAYRKTLIDTLPQHPLDSAEIQDDRQMGPWDTQEQLGFAGAAIALELYKRAIDLYDQEQEKTHDPKTPSG